MNEHAFYITTTTPYVNSSPHIGFALEIVAADVIARHQKMLGKDIKFNTGTDEHGQKIYQEAQQAGLSPQAFVDQNAEKFRALKDLLNLSFTNFIRTTEEHHIQAAQHFWQLCANKGDIYKQLYKITYCVGCELEKQASELVDGKCPLHPNKELEIREEENYFFRFSKYQDKLLQYYQDHPYFVKPESKMKEITAFVAGGLQDFSISRLKNKMPWGVPVPGDDEHVMYVWFDALVNYISTLGWPEDQTSFETFWPGIQIAGKDNLRQQSAMWQAMLLSAGLPLTKNILINGFISVEGQKMSKSLGNVISPDDMIKRYGVDGTRYLLTKLGPVGGDMDVSWEEFDTIYTANLANSIRNTCSRVAKLCENDGVGFTESNPVDGVIQQFHQELSNFEVKNALQIVEHHTKSIEDFLSQTQPWKQAPTERMTTLRKAIEKLLVLGELLTPFMPITAQQIQNHFTQQKVAALEPLFPRLN